MAILHYGKLPYDEPVVLVGLVPVYQLHLGAAELASGDAVLHRNTHCQVAMEGPIRLEEVGPL
jgi:hypothetical protein